MQLAQRWLRLLGPGQDWFRIELGFRRRLGWRSSDRLLLNAAEQAGQKPHYAAPSWPVGFILPACRFPLKLHPLQPTPVVALNAAVAIAMADGPERGLELMEPLGPELDDYHLYHSARAELLTRVERHPDAIEAYRRALALAPSEPERRFLRRRLVAMRS